MSKRKYTHIKLFEKEILAMKDAGKTKREIAEALGLEKASFTSRLSVTSTTTVSYLTRWVRSRIYISCWTQLKRRRERKRSLQSCNSTVTKAFNTHRKHISTWQNHTAFSRQCQDVGIRMIMLWLKISFRYWKQSAFIESNYNHLQMPEKWLMNTYSFTITKESSLKQNWPRWSIGISSLLNWILHRRRVFLCGPHKLD